MNRRLTYLLLALAAVLWSSCERRPLYDYYGGNLYIDVEPELDLEDTPSRGEIPQLYAVAFYDPDTHQLVKTEYVPAGGGYVSVSPGDYDLLVYNFDTEYTQLRGHNQLYSLEAFTSAVTSDVSNRFSRVTEILSRYRSGAVSRGYEGQSLIFEPDHLYAYQIDNLHVPICSASDEVLYVTVYPTTILEKYSLTIRKIINGAYVQTAEVFLTGMASAKLVSERRVSAGPSTIWFPIQFSDDRSKLYTHFLTFGKFPGADNRVVLVMHMTDVTGNEYDGEWDVTDQIDSGEHEIVIDTEIEILPPSPGSGGATPTVSQWDETVTNIVLK